MTDEPELINRARDGEPDAFRQLVERSRITTYRLAYDLTGNRHDAEDLSQDTYIRAYRGLPGFRGDAKWTSWLHRITVNTFLDKKRSEKMQSVEYNDEMDSAESDGPVVSSHPSHNPERRAEAAVLRRHVDEALGRLSPGERSVFVMRHYHDLPLKEIASMLNLAEGTVKAHLFRAVHRLRKELDFLRGDLGLKGSKI